MTTETMNRPEQLQREAADARSRIRDLEDRRAELLRDAISASRAGRSPNGTRAKLLEADAELDILRGLVAEIEAEIPGAERQIAAETVAEIVEGAEAVRERAREVVSAASEALRTLVSEARKLEALSVEYTNEVHRARNIAKGANVPEPTLTDDLMAVAFPASPDRWGLGYWWGQRISPALTDLEHVVTALDGAKHWNKHQEAAR